MNISSKPSNIVTLRPGDPRFTITDGFVVAQRAGFEISQSCPAEYKSIFVTAIKAGWLKPVANIYGKELTMDALR